MFGDCAACKDILVAADDEGVMPIMEADGTVSDDIDAFIKSVNRGGLLRPSALAFAVCIKSWLVWQVIKNDTELKRQFLSSRNVKTLFVTIVKQLLDEDCEFEDIIADGLVCRAGHITASDLVGRFFNAMVSNYVRSLSSGSSVVPSNAKVRKLYSKC